MTSAEFSHRNAVAPQRLLRISQFHRVHSNCSFEKCIFENTKYKLILKPRLLIRLDFLRSNPRFLIKPNLY